MNKVRALILAVLVAAAPAQAIQQPGEVYRHGSGLVAPAELAGLVRYQEQARDGDLVLSYRDAQTQTLMTVYFTRSALPNASLWFDQARYAIQHNPAFRIDTGSSTEEAFAAGGGETNGRAVSYRTLGGGMRATALAMVSTGGRILKLRISSARLDRAELLRRVVSAAQALQWAAASSVPPLTVLEACGDALAPAGDGARPVQSSPELVREASSALLGSLAEVRAAPLCRAARASLLGVYGGVGGGYVLAIGDAGLTARVRPLGRDNLHIVEFFTFDSAHVAGLFEGMPSPEQALQASTSAFQGQALARIPLADPAERPEPGAPLT